MEAKKQTDFFITAMLRHCAGVEVMALRNVGTTSEQPTTPRRVRGLGDLERLRGWLWHENASRAANIFVRPGDAEHPWLFLDDVSKEKAKKIAGRWAALVVETSPGNCQLRILASRPLAEAERFEIQRALAVMHGADLGSTAGTKWGRLPGYKNMKPGRGGCWTNLIADTTSTARPFSSRPLPEAAHPSPAAPAAIKGGAWATERRDGNGEFRAEFAFACHRLRDGLDAGEIARLIADHALRRGKRRTWPEGLRYGEKTVAAALRSLHP